jgi:N-acetylmuramoyl-L-alanine amidase
VKLDHARAYLQQRRLARTTLPAAGLRFIVLLLLGSVLAAAPSAAGQDAYFILLGTRLAALDGPAVVRLGGGDYINLAALAQLQAPQAMQAADAAPTYLVGGHQLAFAAGGALSLDGTALAVGELRDFRGGRYLASSVLERMGLRLSFNSTQDLYQLLGQVARVDYSASPPLLSVACSVPLSVYGEQVDGSNVTLTLEGAWLAETRPRELPAGGAVSRLGFKSQPELGRSFIYVRQPQRTGFKIDCDPQVGYARIKFANFLQLANWQQSSSGEISLNVQLGAPVEIETQLLDNPPRLVADFAGASYEDATQSIPVRSGRASSVRVGAPQAGSVRVVLDLTEAVDWRVLRDDDGARYFIQLLPRVERTAPPSRRRVGRTVMIDAGHGGSDPGAQGVLSGVWEAPLTLAISKLLKARLEDLGYTVLLTRQADRFTSLGTRGDYANSVLPYVFVSIHCNSIETPEFSGLMSFHYPGSVEGEKLAGLVEAEALAATGAVDKGVREANFFVLRETVMPSTLVECGFLTNKDECALLIDPDYQARLAAGIARGIDRYVTGGL